MENYDYTGLFNYLFNLIIMMVISDQCHYSKELKLLKLENL
jgi:hypothetical protein